MKIIPPLGATDGTPYVQGDPTTGTAGSYLDARAITHPMAEIVAAITAAGLVPSVGDLTQLAQAIDARVLNGRIQPGRLLVTEARTIALAELGRFVQFGGASSFTATLPDPSTCPGASLYFYNGAANDKTLSTPVGAFLGSKGSGDATHVLPRGASAWVTAGATNWIVMYQTWSIAVVTTATTLKPNSLGGYIQVNGTPGFTVTLPDPTGVSGADIDLHNTGSQDHTLATPTGIFIGPAGSGSSTMVLTGGKAVRLRAGFSNWVVFGYGA